MVDEKGLEAEAADRIGEWVQMSGGQELVEKLLGSTEVCLTNRKDIANMPFDQGASLRRVQKQKLGLKTWRSFCATVTSTVAGLFLTVGTEHKYTSDH